MSLSLERGAGVRGLCKARSGFGTSGDEGWVRDWLLLDHHVLQAQAASERQIRVGLGASSLRPWSSSTSSVPVNPGEASEAALPLELILDILELSLGARGHQCAKSYPDTPHTMPRITRPEGVGPPSPLHHHSPRVQVVAAGARTLPAPITRIRGEHPQAQRLCTGRDQDRHERDQLPVKVGASAPAGVWELAHSGARLGARLVDAPPGQLSR